jgi:HNH endonuclease
VQRARGDRGVVVSAPEAHVEIRILDADSVRRLTNRVENPVAPEFAVNRKRLPVPPIGTVFGRLTVIGPMERMALPTKSACGVPVRCTCGATKTVAIADLKRGTKSCGCWLRTERVPAAVRLWRRVDKNGPIVRPGLGRCWVWTGSVNEDGYGRIHVFDVGHLVATHQFAYRLECGDVPDGQVVRHLCDNPPCCNPAHLVLGTVADNVRDMMERGRHVALRGSQNSQSVLNEGLVREIRAASRAGESHSSIAYRIGVTPQCIRLVVTRKSWRHVADGPEGS